MKTSGPTEKQVTDEKEALLCEFETRSKLNNYPLNQIALRYQAGEECCRDLEHSGVLQENRRGDDSAKTYLNTRK